MFKLGAVNEAFAENDIHGIGTHFGVGTTVWRRIAAWNLCASAADLEGSNRRSDAVMYLQDIENDIERAIDLHCTVHKETA